MTCGQQSTKKNVCKIKIIQNARSTRGTVINAYIPDHVLVVHVDYVNLGWTMKLRDLLIFCTIVKCGKQIDNFFFPFHIVSLDCALIESS